MAVMMLHLCDPLQCALESCVHRRAVGTGHSMGLGDLMHVVRGLRLTTLNAHVVTAAVVTSALVVCVCACLLCILMQAHCGVGERLFDLVNVVFRMQDLELHPGTPMLTLAARANDSMGELLFR